MKNNRIFLISLIFFQVGFGWYFIHSSLLFFLLYLLLYNKSYFSLKLYKQYYYFSIIFFISLLLLFVIGSRHMTLSFPDQNYIMLFYVTSMLSWIIYKEKSIKNIILFIFIYLLGLYIYSLSVVLYSYFQNPYLYGYGLLLNPFNMQEVNSPSFSNNLLLTTIGFYFILRSIKNQNYRFILWCMIFIAVFAAAFLGGRTYFILLAFYIFIFNYKAFISVKAFIYLSFISLLVFYLSTNYHIFDFILLRFDEQGLDTNNRLNLAIYGISRLLDYPFGGIIIPSFYGHPWFHNLWLDIFRVSGLLPLLLFLSTNLQILYIYLKQSRRTLFVQMLFVYILICMLIFSQDIIIEGNISPLYLYSFLVAFWFRLISNKKLYSI